MRRRWPPLRSSTSGISCRCSPFARVLGDRVALKRLEAIVHPLVQQAEQRHLAEAEARGEKVAVLDIPLLFETGGEERVDAVVVVSAPPEVQRSRALERSAA